jgi:phosphohistidine phosphatase
MKLFLMRHGDALDGFDDAKRPLSKKGVREALLAGEFLKRAGEAPDVIYHSGLLRSSQTAFGVARRLGLERKLFERSGLLPGNSVSSFSEELDGDEADILLTGHLPFVSCLASLLLTGSELTIEIKFTTGAVAALERQRNSDAWKLRFHATAKMISRLVSGKVDHIG